MIVIDLRIARLTLMRQQYHCIGVEACHFPSPSEIPFSIFTVGHRLSHDILAVSILEPDNKMQNLVAFFKFERFPIL